MCMVCVFGVCVCVCVYGMCVVCVYVTNKQPEWLRYSWSSRLCVVPVTYPTHARNRKQGQAIKPQGPPWGLSSPSKASPPQGPSPPKQLGTQPSGDRSHSNRHSSVACRTVGDDPAPAA